MKTRVHLASVVTQPSLRQFSLLRFSFELFHGREFQWVVRCDRASQKELEGLPGIVCSPILTNSDGMPSSDSPSLLCEKMNAMGDAWEHAPCDVVVFLAADLVFTSSCMREILAIPGDLVLTSNHFPWRRLELAPYYGYFNSGFVLSKNPEFHADWQTALLSQPWRYLDQGVLNEVATRYRTATLSPAANVGAWRSEAKEMFYFLPIPNDCQFVRVPLFTALTSPAQWIDRVFGLHFIHFLTASQERRHKLLLREILQSDTSGWYASSLHLLGCEVDSITIGKSPDRLLLGSARNSIRQKS